MRSYLLGAGVNGALGVAMGAWAAHGLQATLPAPAIEWIRTGASYQLWHAAALLGLAALARDVLKLEEKCPLQRGFRRLFLALFVGHVGRPPPVRCVRCMSER